MHQQGMEFVDMVQANETGEIMQKFAYYAIIHYDLGSGIYSKPKSIHRFGEKDGIFYCDTWTVDGWVTDNRVHKISGFEDHDYFEITEAEALEFIKANQEAKK